jgi:hypothetical protein
VIVGVEVYPRPSDKISMPVTNPFVTVGIAVAVIPQGSFGELIVTVGVELYPLPALVIVILSTVLYNSSKYTT